MFDNLKPQDNLPSSVLEELNRDKNYPFKKVSDNSTPLAERKLAGNKAPVEDILADTDLGQTITENPPRLTDINDIKPSLKETVQVPTMIQPSAVSKNKPVAIETNINTVDKSIPTVNRRGGKKIILILIIVLVVAGAAFAAYTLFLKPTPTDNNGVKPNESLDELINVLDQNNPQNNENPVDLNVNDNEDLPPENPPVTNNDTDNDGLTDEQEETLGTDPLKFDTDIDGLNDFEEIEIYHSDPLKADTDGDGYSDGSEVQQGYDPLKGGGAKM